MGTEPCETILKRAQAGGLGGRAGRAVADRPLSLRRLAHGADGYCSHCRPLSCGGGGVGRAEGGSSATAQQSLLGLLLVPDKANALLYLLFFGLWPMLKSLLERIPVRPLEWLCKLAVFNAVLTLFWFGLHSLFLPFLPETLQASWMVYAAGNAAFVIYDVGFSKLISFYVARVDRVLRKTLVWYKPQQRRMKQGNRVGEKYDGLRQGRGRGPWPLHHCGAALRQ
ncbi:MAG: hypothetical protein ACLS63_03005 [Flavonifractor plautii]